MTNQKIYQFDDKIKICDFRLKRANIMCPTPIKLRKHVLLMSMIGDTRPAQKLKELQWTDEQMKQNAFEQVREVRYDLRFFTIHFFNYNLHYIIWIHSDCHQNVQRMSAGTW